MKWTLALLLTLCVCLTGCKDKDEAKQILPALDAAFPKSAILKVDKRVLWIQTQVGGISATTAEQLYIAAIQKATKSYGKLVINVQTELALDDKQFLIIGFKDFFLGWDVRNGLNPNGLPMHVQVMDYPHLQAWLTQRIGYAPTKEQILVERIQELQSMEAGQPVQLPTLASLIAVKRDELRQELEKQDQPTTTQQ